MQIAALSDFHIGSSSRSDCFRHSLAGFHEFLDDLESEHERIVLLGDIFQSEHGAGLSPSVKRRELRRAQARVAGLWERLQGPPYEYVHGNHDAWAAQDCAARETLRVEQDGFVVFFIHGHQFDPLLRRAYPLAQASTWFSGRLRRFGLGPIADYLEHKDIEIKHRAFRGGAGPYVVAARELLAREGADAVIMGHTHVAQHTALAQGVYANTGTCSMNQRMYLSIDTRARSVALR